MQSLSEIFNDRFFRVPDYQRGYSWEDRQREDFWKDVTWLRKDQKHYTGMLTLHKVIAGNGTPVGHNVFHVVDGQQRLTSFFILLSKLIKKRSNSTIGGRNASVFYEKYFKMQYDDKSYSIFDYEDPRKSRFFNNLLDSSREETMSITPANIYERHLIDASLYFDAKLDGIKEIQIDEYFKKITNQLFFDVHDVESSFEVSAMFESINYRGKKLSKFEVLKNRLIYLVECLSVDDNKDYVVEVRSKIDEAWGRAFDSFGMDSEINDEDLFLMQHTIMYFGPLEQIKDSLDQRLFKEKFAIDRVREEGVENKNPIALEEIRLYVNNIIISSDLWAIQNSCFIKRNDKKWFDAEIFQILLRITRMTDTAFRPVILAALNSVDAGIHNSMQLKSLLNKIERFTFIVYELCNISSKQSRNKIVAWANEIFKSQNNSSFELLEKYIDLTLCDYDVDEGEYTGLFDTEKITNSIYARFHDNDGWYSWKGIKYFLSEWRCYMEKSDVLLKHEYLNLQVEHIMPKDPGKDSDWFKIMKKYGKKSHFIKNDLGNLTLLGLGANAAVKDHNLKSKSAAYATNSDGADVIKRSAPNFDWNDDRVVARGKDMLRYMMLRWDIPFQNENSNLKIDFEYLLSIKAPRKTP